jgi:hypothetical protein
MSKNIKMLESFGFVKNKTNPRVKNIFFIMDDEYGRKYSEIEKELNISGNIDSLIQEKKKTDSLLNIHSPKIQYIFEKCRDETSKNNKCVILARFKSTGIKSLMKLLDVIDIPYKYIDGKTNFSTILEKYNKNKIRILIVCGTKEPPVDKINSLFVMEPDFKFFDTCKNISNIYNLFTIKENDCVNIDHDEIIIESAHNYQFPHNQIPSIDYVIFDTMRK